MRDGVPPKKISDKDFEIVNKAMHEMTYYMWISEEDRATKRIVVDSYDYNMDSEFLWKNRVSYKTNNIVSALAFMLFCD